MILLSVRLGRSGNSNYVNARGNLSLKRKLKYRTQQKKIPTNGWLLKGSWAKLVNPCKANRSRVACGAPLKQCKFPISNERRSINPNLFIFALLCLWLRIAEYSVSINAAQVSMRIYEWSYSVIWKWLKWLSLLR